MTLVAAETSPENGGTATVRYLGAGRLQPRFVSRTREGKAPGSYGSSS
ncbi:hypothetical protein [Actinoplanes couchii]|nr:hypothetical protein [Actinoplanes couchii]MDR6324120.1 hypothetical protein [Actinoplanes couchii]